MKGLPWGPMYDANRDRTDLDPDALEARIQELMADEDVTRKSGVYRYLLDGDERHLSIRAFDRRTQRAAYEAQGAPVRRVRRRVRPGGHACGPHRPVEPWRAHRAGQLPDAVP